MKETKVNGIIYKKSSRFRNYSDSTLNDILNASKNDILANNSSDINEMDKYKTRSPKTNLIGFGNNSHINTEIRKSQDLTEKIILKQKREIPFLKNVNINNRNSKGTKFER
jgi:hypothetical protein